MSVPTSLFGCNTYSYMRSHSAGDCIAQLAEIGFREFELMVHPGHLWPAELSTETRGELRRAIERLGVEVVSLNMPNIDINIAAAASEMRGYSLNLLTETVRLAGDLGARGVVIGPGKANPLFPAEPHQLTGHFYAALDHLAPIAKSAGTALWAENMPFAFLPGISDLTAALDRYGNDAVCIVYDAANAHFIGEDITTGLQQCAKRLALVHLSDTGRGSYRHDPIGSGTVPFAHIPAALAAVGYVARPMLEIISSNPDAAMRDGAARLITLGFAADRSG